MENRIGGDRGVVLDIGQAVAGKVDDLTIADDGDAETRHLAVFDLRLQVAVKLFSVAHGCLPHATDLRSAVSAVALTSG